MDWKNKLYFGDNLDILRDKIPENFIDLVYLDPPFKSGKAYNIIFEPESYDVRGATAQIQTFEDTWRWGEEANKNYQGLINGSLTKEKPTPKLIEFMKSMRNYLGECSMLAYLSMMGPRLLEMRRVLKNTGSIYLHCDPTASHYLKLLMDAIFGVGNFRNEIVWCYTGREHPKISKFPQRHQIILLYVKDVKSNPTFNKLFQEYAKGYVDLYFDQVDEAGRKFQWQPNGKGGKYKQYLDESPGIRIPDWWEIKPLHGKDMYTMHKKEGEEYIGYPTQKPEKLLERVIRASSNEGDLIMDPFCGCGTAVIVAEKLKRRWIGIDITYLAIDVIFKRFKRIEKVEGIKFNFEVEGEPKDVYSAKKLAEKNSFQFQIWCISKFKNAIPSQTKTGDKGTDGIIYFSDHTKKDKIGKAIIQVKGTENVSPSMVRELKGTLYTQHADFGILITFREKPTQGMIEEASSEYYRLGEMSIPQIQILSVADLFKDPIPVKIPTYTLSAYREKKLTIERDLHLFDSKR